MSDIRTSTSAILAGRAKALKFFTRFMVEWTEPQMDAMLLAWWKQLTPGQHAQLEQTNPGAYAQAKEQFERMEVANAHS